MSDLQQLSRNTDKLDAMINGIEQRIGELEKKILQNQNAVTIAVSSSHIPPKKHCKVVVIGAGSFGTVENLIYSKQEKMFQNQ